MNPVEARACPVCGGRPSGPAYPYATRYNDVQFDFLKCNSCKSVYVDPCPDAQTFARMYAKSEYHDVYYDEGESDNYIESARLLNRHVKPGATVLDYGCGTGGFLKACASLGLVQVGVEFDAEAALSAAKAANCEVLTLHAFGEQGGTVSYDAIHLGDVLEHLADPAATLAYLLGFLKPGGFLFVEGPLQANPSPVFWAARAFGSLKRVLRPRFVASDPPQHLIYTNERAQKEFFLRVNAGLRAVHWQVVESGWPYASGGRIKRGIAAIAMWMGGRRIAHVTFGNRFRSIWVLADATGN